MPATVAVRDLRDAFEKVKRLVERDGSVIVSDYGKPEYLLSCYSSEMAGTVAPKDYLARLKRHQPVLLDSAEAAALRDDNRGDG